ncbi:MAG: 4-phosphoerythronate dehydrogenase [Cellvibrionaceae bacterium]|nr:4-phosphoerythronate dehydrogenase [Cellvibrionaceae bacterium]
MNILADHNIPLLTELFADLGTVTRLPGREITAADLVQTDILLVRSVTEVNARLLATSPVKFVGSCTIGTDHLDKAYLEAHNIHWAYAPGCNANAVVQYVLSAMAVLRPQWQQQTLGIIGCGNIGGRLYRLMRALGVRCYCYDPLLDSPQNLDLHSLEAVLGADIISCHVPLTDSGAYPTRHLLSRRELAQLAPGTLFINSSRGGVIDERALQQSLLTQDLQVVLDVWEGEPVIDRTLLSQVSLGTPHIAGYSLEGKARGSVMIYQALCEYLQRQPSSMARVADSSPSPWPYSMDSAASVAQQLNCLLTQCYDIVEDDRRLRKVQPIDSDWGRGFDDLRKHYPVRREYSAYHFPETLGSVQLLEQLAVLQAM